jgi:hypothetical protein
VHRFPAEEALELGIAKQQRIRLKQVHGLRVQSSASRTLSLASLIRTSTYCVGRDGHGGRDGRI